MPAAAPVSRSITARVIHAALMLGVMLFCVVAWYVATRTSMPVSAIPNRRVLYLGLTAVSAILFGAAMHTAARLTPPRPGISHKHSVPISGRES